MERERIEQVLARLDAAAARAEQAAHVLAAAPAAAREDFAGLQERHSQLKATVARSLRQLDDILAEMPK